jgi:CheY-like chemotaxis protein
VRSASRAADLTAKLLAFARRGKSLSVAVDLHALIREVMLLLERSIDPRVTLKAELDAASPVTLGDPTQLQNALLNLGLNARDAMPNGGTMTFQTDMVTREGSIRDVGWDAEPGRHVRVEVSDTGTGMDMNTLRKLFEPFFTTKPQGTGMGLAAVYGTVKAHRGTIDVDSIPGEGTTFTLYLPHHSGEPVPDSRPRTSAPEGKLNAHVLVAEDEPAVASVVSGMLEHLGCRVTVCSDGEQALTAYGAAPDAFDLVLLDMTMPRVSGSDTFARIRTINPDAVVVLASGYAADAGAQRLLDGGAAGFLRKPFRVGDLSRVLEQALAGPADDGSN